MKCGVNEILPGFGYKDSSGAFKGFDVDLCRAVAAAVFGDVGAVKYEALTSAARFEAVNSGLIDLLVRNTTWTQSRDTDLGLDFGPTTYYTGQQLMAKEADGFNSTSTLDEIEGAAVCATAGTHHREEHHRGGRRHGDQDHAQYLRGFQCGAGELQVGHL